FLARDEALSVYRREEEAAALVVCKELHREQRVATRLLEPAQLARRDVELVKPVRDVRVVVQVAGPARASRATAAVQATPFVGERTEQELAQSAGFVDKLRPPESTPALGERREGEAVPRRDRLVVQPRLRALSSDLQEARPRLGIEL